MYFKKIYTIFAVQSIISFYKRRMALSPLVGGGERWAWQWSVCGNIRLCAPHVRVCRLGLSGCVNVHQLCACVLKLFFFFAGVLIRGLLFGEWNQVSRIGPCGVRVTGAWVSFSPTNAVTMRQLSLIHLKSTPPPICLLCAECRCSIFNLTRFSSDLHLWYFIIAPRCVLMFFIVATVPSHQTSPHNPPPSLNIQYTV